MPMYVYQVIEEDGTEGEIFEVLQSMSEAPLTHHPESGKPVRKLLSAPNSVRKFADGNLNPSKLESLGFTQYKRSGKGSYEKTAGKGPDLIAGDG